MFALSVLLAAILPGMYVRMTAPAKQEVEAVNRPLKISDDEENDLRISIDKAKSELNEKHGDDFGLPEKGPATLAQVYATYPDATVGNNIVASWARTSPAEKARVEEQLDKQITVAQDTLRTEPENKDAKHMLFIASTLKKLCKSNFDYNLLEDVPEEEGGLLPRSKKAARP